jgi:hypothetical protein
MNQKHPRKPFFTATMLAIVLLLQGCATLDKDECRLADWHLLGYQDGVAGKSATQLGVYREDCAKHAVVPDLDAYRAGRQEGLQQFCKASNGFRLGNAGHGFAAVCPVALEGEFRAGYNAGRERYLARTAVNKTHASIRNRKQTLSSLEDDRAQKLAALIADGLKADQRVMIIYELNEVQQEMDIIEDEIDELEYDLANQQARLEHLNRNNNY